MNLETARIFRELSFHVDAIQAGISLKPVIEESAGCISLKFDNIELREFVAQKEEEWLENNTKKS